MNTWKPSGTADVSIETIFAWASGERTHAAHSWPVRLMSST